jgi:hypothetical protein
VVLLRCAWHKKYFGYPWIYGVVSWRGRDVSFSDGMCGTCARRWRAYVRGTYNESAARATWPVPAWILGVALVAVLGAAVLLAAHQTPLPREPDAIAESLPSRDSKTTGSGNASPRVTSSGDDDSTVEAGRRPVPSARQPCSTEAMRRTRARHRSPAWMWWRERGAGHLTSSCHCPQGYRPASIAYGGRRGLGIYLVAAQSP